MKKIGIKFFNNLEYEQFEACQYLLDFDFEYDDLEEYIENGTIIELDIEEDEDRVEDIEALKELVQSFEEQDVKYELFVFENEWSKEVLENIC